VRAGGFERLDAIVVSLQRGAGHQVDSESLAETLMFFFCSTLMFFLLLSTCNTIDQIA